MWLKSVYLKTVHDHGIGAMIWGLGPGILVIATLTQFGQLLGSPEARAALLEMAEAFKWYEAPIGITQPGGFVTFRLGPMLGILPSVWALLAASGTLRGEEQRGALDLLLSTPRSRGRVVLEKLAGLATALALMAAVMGTLVWVAGIASGAEYGAPGAYVFGLNVALTAGVFGAIALLVSQFTSERSAAAGITGACLGLAFVLNGTGRVSPDLKWVSYLSPLYYAGLTKPLVPEVGINPGAMLLLAAIMATCTAGAAWLFTRRDLGSGYRPPFAPRLSRAPLAGEAGHVYVFGGNWSLRSIYRRDLSSSGRAALWWAAGIAAYSIWMTTIVRLLQRSLAAIAGGSPLLATVLSRVIGGVQENQAFLGTVVFTFLPLVFSAFAVSQTVLWAADEEEGRTEMVLASPFPRWGVLLARFAAIATALVFMALAAGVSVGGAAAATGFALEPSHLVAAALGMVPVALFVGSLGALLAGWLRAGLLSGALTIYVVASFFLALVAPVFGWPKAVIRLSIYEVYGTPLSSGWDWPAMGALAAVAAGGLALATYRFSQKDLAR